MDRMYLSDSGKGDAVLLLHGTPSPAAEWSPIVEALTSRYRVLVPDLPGYGRSPTLADSSIESVGNALAAMLAQRRIDRLHAIIGFSTGAYRAFDLVLRHRLPTKLIVSLGGMACFEDSRQPMRGQFADLLEADPTLIATDTVRGHMCNRMLSRRWRDDHPGDESRVIGWLDTTTGPALASEVRALASARDLRPALPRLDAYVYARVGELDVGAPPALSRDIIDAVPRGELDIVPGCGHALLIEDLPATSGAILARVRALD